MLSPSSCTATCSASKLPTSSAPTAAMPALSQLPPGNCQSGLVTKSRGRAVAVERHEGAARLHHGQRGLVRGHDGVAADHQIGLGVSTLVV
jgi:hypothetical protein